ncbi:MAG: ACT domain-containing protein [Clostridia bacterium]|nr:ACT domain-containing protein [Clostridia bacterium]
MRAVITVIGRDVVGILAEVSGKCSELNVNIAEVTQSVLQDMFCMIMLVDMDKCSIPLADFSDIMKKLGEKHGLSIHVMHGDVFDSMYHV